MKESLLGFLKALVPVHPDSWRFNDIRGHGVPYWQPSNTYSYHAPMKFLCVSVFMYKCMCMRMSTFMYMPMSIYMCMSMSACWCSFMCMCMYTYTYMGIRICANIHMKRFGSYTCTYAYVRRRMHLHTYIMCIYIYTLIPWPQQDVAALTKLKEAPLAHIGGVLIFSLWQGGPIGESSGQKRSHRTQLTRKPT